MLPPLTLFSVGVADGELVALLVEGASSLLLEQAVKVPIAMIAAPPAKSAQWRVIRREFMIVSHLAGSGPVGRRDWLVRHIVPGVNKPGASKRRWVIDRRCPRLRRAVEAVAERWV